MRWEREWQVQEAKARFSEIFRLTRERGPQRITRHGKDAVVMLPAEEYERLRSAKPRRKETLVELLARSPLKGSAIDLTRPRDYPRDIEL